MNSDRDRFNDQLRETDEERSHRLERARLRADIQLASGLAALGMDPKEAAEYAANSSVASLSTADPRIGLKAAQDAFLDLIADAQRFETDVDGDEHDGRTVIARREFIGIVEAVRFMADYDIVELAR